MIAGPSHSRRTTVVVVGNGMVGHRFCERLVEFDTQRQSRIVVFGEEPRPAYDRVRLSEYFRHRDPQQLALTDARWYADHGIELHLGDQVIDIDRFERIIWSKRRVEMTYDVLVLATGSSPFVPPTPGIDLPGVFVYRTIEDLERIVSWGRSARSAAVIGGGLLGLEAAKAALDMGLETHIIEYAPRLLPRQLDERGAQTLKSRIESLGAKVHLNASTQQILGECSVAGLRFADGSELNVDMVIVSAGIRPRDELARYCGLDLGPRGGVIVNDALLTSDPHIYAIGEVALHRGMIYGLVAPGYEMAEVLAANLTGHSREFKGADLSTKLKLMGIDVASFGQYEADADVATSFTFEDPVAGVYKKLLVTSDGKHLLGGMLVGDASDFPRLLGLCRSGKPLPGPAAELLLGKAAADGGADLDDAALTCSCQNVTEAQLCEASVGAPRAWLN